MTASLHLPSAAAQMIRRFLQPAFIIFVVSNVVNLGNLAFNMVFSRWMGPELFGDLALILTIKLGILGFLGAVQMAVSQMTAGDVAGELDSALARLTSLALRGSFLIAPVLGLLIFGLSIESKLDLGEPGILLVLLIAFPFALPMSILRGVAFGRILAGRVVASGMVEMLVRLIGAIIAWQSGWGIYGVVFAMALSIISAWVVLADLVKVRGDKPVMAPMAIGLAAAAFPFAVLQLAQTVLLDGDVFLAKSFLGNTEAGLIAALSLFQRIQFFGCFALATVLLPTVVRAAGQNRAVQSAVPIVGLFAAVTVVVLGAILVAPDLLVSVMVGPDFVAAAPVLWIACLSAAAFTLSYLLATFLGALGDYRGIWFLAVMAPVQIVTMAFVANHGLQDMLFAKLSVQIVSVVLLMGLTAWRLNRTKASR